LGISDFPDLRRRRGTHRRLQIDDQAETLQAWEQAITDRILIHKFDETDAPEVLTSISEECSVACTFQRKDAADKTIFWRGFQLTFPTVFDIFTTIHNLETL
jgi:hypothetical protein